KNPAPLSGVPQREFAEWFLKQGGILWLHGKPGDFHTIEELPEGDVRVRYVLDTEGILGDEHLPVIASLPEVTMIQIASDKLTGNNLALLNDVKKLRYLSLANSPVNDANFARFDNFANLSELSIAGTQISSSFIPRLAECRKLEFLSVTEQQILHPEGIEFLTAIDTLNCVGIHDFTDASAQLLSELNLKRINFHDGRAVSQATMDAICRSKSLRRIKFWNTDLSEVDFSSLRKLDDLIWLEIRNTNLSPERVAEIAKLLPNCDIMHSVEHDIEEMVRTAGGIVDAWRTTRRKTMYPTFFFDRQIDSITFAEAPLLRDEHFISYQYLPQLKSLTVNQAGINGSTLKHIRHLKSLEHLSLAETQVSDRHIGFLSHLTGLKSLNLQDTKVTARGLAIIAALMNLESLAIDGLQITPETLAILAELPRLHELQLSRASDTTITQIASLERLEQLTIDASFTVTEASLPSLAKLERLESLKLGKTNIPKRYLDDFKSRNPKCTIATLQVQGEE
ncbi:MAG: hypothetical protein AAF394_02980, partial [Planctomycetota bacterium]